MGTLSHKSSSGFCAFRAERLLLTHAEREARVREITLSEFVRQALRRELADAV